MDAETGMWIVCGLMALGGGISFAGRLGMWAVFHYGSKGKLKVRVVLSDEKSNKQEKKHV
jgi:hypothetical protein